MGAKTAISAALATFMAAAILTVDTAQAADTDLYVDHDFVGASDAACSAATPCKTIAAAIAVAGDGAHPGADTIHVGESTSAYGPVNVPDSPITLLGGEYNYPGSEGVASEIAGGASAGVVLAPGPSPRRLSGLSISGNPGIDNSGSSGTTTTVDHNQITQGSAGSILMNLGGTVSATDNVISGTAGVTIVGMDLESLDGPLNVSRNVVTGAGRGLVISLPSPHTMTVSDNTINAYGFHAGPDTAIFIFQGRGAITGNDLGFTPSGGGQYAFGVFTDGSGNYPTNTGPLTLQRNRILGFPTAAVRYGGLHPLSSESDVIANGGGNGIQALGQSSLSVALTNTTMWGNSGFDLALPVTQLTLNSSILHTGASLAAGSICTSTYSRGPSPVGLGDTCTYATSATPNFNHTDSSADAFTLSAIGNSAFVDMGDPAHPAAGSLDMKGSQREVDGIANATCLPRRDVGADELAASSDCAQPSGGGGGNPSTGGGTVTANPLCAPLRAKFKKAPRGSVKRKRLKKKLNRLGC